MCSRFESDDLLKHTHNPQISNDFDYSSCMQDNIETQTHLTIASMLRDKDQYNIVTMAVFLCGVGSFLTFMTATAAPDYIHAAYPSYPDLLYLLVCVYNTSNMIGVMIMISPAGNYISISGRMSYGYIFTAIFTTFIPFIPYIFQSYSEASQVYIFLLLNGVLCGLSSAISCISLFSFANMLPNTYLVTAVTGQSLAGILAAAIRVSNKLAFNTNQEGTIKSGVGCFVLAAVIQLVAAIIFMFAERTQFVNRYMIGYWAVRDAQYLDMSVKDSYTPIVKEYNYEYVTTYCADFVNPATATALGTKCKSVPTNVEKKASKKVTFTSNSATKLQSQTPTAVQSCEDLEVEMSIKTVSTQTYSEIVTERINSLRFYNKNSFAANDSFKRPLAIFSKKHTKTSSYNPHPTSTNISRKIMKCLLSIFIGYGGTYLVFPSLIVELEVNHEYLMSSQWSAVILYSIWSLFGLIGMYSAKIVHLHTTYDNLWILQFLWLCVMYTMFICAYERMVHNDVYTYAIVAVSPMMFGFFSARTFAELPSRINKFEREIAQAVTQLTLVSGILVGGWIAFTINKLVLS